MAAQSAVDLWEAVHMESPDTQARLSDSAQRDR